MEVRRGLFRTLGGVRFAVGSMKMLLFPASGRFSFFFEKNFLSEAISKVIQKMAKMASQRAAKGSLKLLPAG